MLTSSHKLYYSGPLICLRRRHDMTERQADGTLLHPPELHVIVYDANGLSVERLSWGVARSLAPSALDEIVAAMECDRRAEKEVSDAVDRITQRNASP